MTLSGADPALLSTSTTATRRPDTRDYLELFLREVPLLDLRAPVEFAQGAFPGATNLCLLDDRQRELIGIRYKEAGQHEAVRLGERLATPALRAARIEAWAAFCRAHPDGYLYCFRGGLRSHVAQAWLREAGIDYPLVEGGYKAMRRFLLESFQRDARELPLHLLAGPTGSGKTRVLDRLPHALDLEGLARHRGSAFGGPLSAQPPQIGWENAVSCAMLRHRHRAGSHTPLVLEDEGRLIGRLWLPPILQQAMAGAGLILLDRDLDTRVALVLEDYVVQPWDACKRAGEQALCRFGDEVLGGLRRIRKRLGGLRHAQVEAMFEEGLRTLAARDDPSPFIPAIRLLLLEYYDPMYQYQLERRANQVLFRGPEDEVVDWLVGEAEKWP